MVILSSESKSTGLHFSISISASKKKNNPCQHQHIGSVFVLLKCKGSTGAILLQTNSSISMNMQLAVLYRWHSSVTAGWRGQCVGSQPKLQWWHRYIFIASLKKTVSIQKGTNCCTLNTTPSKRHIYISEQSLGRCNYLICPLCPPQWDQD